MQALIDLEAEIEVEVARKVPEAVEAVKGMLEERPEMTVGELAAALLIAIPDSHLAWYTAFLFMEKAQKEAQVG